MGCLNCLRHRRADGGERQVSLNTQAPAASASSHLESTFPSQKKEGCDVDRSRRPRASLHRAAASTCHCVLIISPSKGMPRSTCSVRQSQPCPHTERTAHLYIKATKLRRNEQIAESIISHVHHPAMPGPGSSPTKAGRRRSSGAAAHREVGDSRAKGAGCGPAMHRARACSVGNPTRGGLPRPKEAPWS